MEKFKTLADVLPACVDGRPVLGAILNNMVVPLATPLVGDPAVEPLTRADREGFGIYRATLAFLLAKCARELKPDEPFRVRYSAGPALYFSWGGDVAALSLALQTTVAADLPVVAEPWSYKDAIDYFSARGRTDECHLLAHRNPPMVVLSRCGDFRALHQVALAPRTGALDAFKLLPVEGGFLLDVPDSAAPDVLPDARSLEDKGSYLQIFRDQLAREKQTGVSTLGDLNQVILERRLGEFVRTVESLQRRSLARIADRIAAREPRVRLVLLAGPSSAGKTTTAHHLCTELRANGLTPLLLSTDDYFVGDARNPVDENGNPDWETVEAVDRERLARDLNALFAGGAVKLRKFDFHKHAGFDAAEESRLPPGGVIVLEGIHALNPILTEGVADDVKFRVFLNALTQPAIDSCNRVSSSDTRLLRRLVRDFHFRGLSPVETFRLWPKVVAGERKWIYPFQLRADAVFNSALDYELAVLKPYALELLNQVKPWDRAYVEARRLSGMLHNVSIASPSVVPGDSILRETIGGSQIEY
ncbi:MAG: nucleoside kinase [Kiritimatiellae bacterium]|nr:nucleoside kinase [Kiritimatiellia bacterium]